MLRVLSLMLSSCLLVGAILACPGVANANLLASVEHSQGRPAAMVSTLQGWSIEDKHRLSEETYRIQTFSKEEFASRLGLLEPERLENAYFRIVENTGEQTLPIGDFDGSNALFHLMRARAHFAWLSEVSGTENPAVDNKIVVRVRVDRAYNLVTHFAEVEDYNNARYIPPHFGGLWGSEIWFDQRKARLEKMPWYAMTSLAGHSMLNQDWKPFAIAAPIQFLDHYNSGLDSAKIPDVVYHEAFHWATDAKGYFPMAAEGNPVAEDYANYFASSLNDRPLTAEVDEFTSRFYKRDYSKLKKVKSASASSYNSTVFVPSLFWRIRGLLGQHRADQLIWSSMKWLRGSSRHTDIPVAVLTAVDQDRELSSEEVREIRALFEKYDASFELLARKFNPFRPRMAPKSGRPESPAGIAPVATSVSGQVDHPGADEAEEIPESPLELTARFIQEAVIFLSKAVGYVATAVGSLTSVPTAFGTDLLTGAIFGHGMLSEREDELNYQVAGAVGGLGVMEATVSGLSSEALSILGGASLVGMGASLANTLICQGADLRGVSETDKYCSEVRRISTTIEGFAARAGAGIGKAIHEFFVKLFAQLGLINVVEPASPR